MKLIIKILVLSFLSVCNLYANPPSTPTKNVVSNSDSTSKINLNTADVSVLAHSIKGIGQKRAEAIIQYREAHQGFKSLDELAKVSGIGHRFTEVHAQEIEKIFSVK